MHKIFEKTKGAISIFLALIMLPMFTFAGLILDGVRLESAQSAISGAGNLALNAGLSEYNETLLNVYGLFAVSKTDKALSNNLNRYFTNTLEANNLLESSDSYTRNFLNSISTYFSNPDSQTYDNLLQLQNDAAQFTVAGVANSQLSNPEVLDRQIIEYMKYRGPVSLGVGFLEKLNILGEVPKQNEAIQAKVEYDKSMSDVQTACDNAYKSLKEYKTLLANSGVSNDPASLNANVNSDLLKAQKLQTESTEYLIAYNSSVLKPGVIKDVTVQSTDDIAAARNNYNTSKTAIDLLHLVSSVGEIPTTSQNEPILVQSKIDYILNYNDNLTQLGEILAVSQAFVDIYNKTYSGAVESNEYSTDYESAKALITQINLQTSLCKSLYDSFREDGGKKASEAAQLLSKYSILANDAIKKLDEANKNLDLILKKIKDLEAKGKTWSSKNEALSDGDMKMTMQQDYANSAKSLNAAAINSLVSELDKSSEYFTGLSACIKNVTYHNLSILPDKISMNNFEYADRYLSLLPANYKKNSAISELAQSDIDSNYVNQTTSGLNPGEYIPLDLEKPEQEFYKYLSLICSKSTETKSDKNKDAANQQKTTLLDQGIKPTPDKVSSGTIDAIGSISSNGSNTYTSPKSDSSNSDIATSSSTNMSSMGNMLSSLGQLGENARDNAYLMEYITQMFSYYTVNSNQSSSSTTSTTSTTSTKATPTTVPSYSTTLSNVNICKENNKFYRAEVEYILWGRANAQENVTATQGMIFALRFILNSIYAFKSADIRMYTLGAATAIAGWTGFGVPIVQTVLILALAAAESVVDLKALNMGKAVALYKTADTWKMSPSGIFEMGKTATVDVSKKIASDAAGVFFDKIEDYANSSTAEIEAQLDSFTEQTEKSIVSSAIGAAMVPVQSMALSVISSSDNLKEDCTDYVTAKVDACILGLVSSVADDGSLSAKLKIAAINYLQTDGRSILIETIKSCKDDFNSGSETIVNGIQNKLIEDLNRKVSDSISLKLKGLIDSASNDFKESVKAELSKAEDGTQAKIEEMTNKYLSDMGGSSGSTTQGSGTTEKTLNSAGGGLTMTYEEYLKVFVLLATISPNWKTAMLTRTATLIQYNMKNTAPADFTTPQKGTYSLANKGSFVKDANFDMTKAFTMLGIEATVQVNTTFYGGLGVTTKYNEETGQTSRDFDYNNIGSNWQILKYYGISSY